MLDSSACVECWPHKAVQPPSGAAFLVRSKPARAKVFFTQFRSHLE
jgi:hypothetical protein